MILFGLPPCDRGRKDRACRTIGLAALGILRRNHCCSCQPGPLQRSTLANSRSVTKDAMRDKKRS